MHIFDMACCSNSFRVRFGITRSSTWFAAICTGWRLRAVSIAAAIAACPLAPLLGALYLAPLDEALAPFGAYLRFMDDWIVFTHSRRQMQKAVHIARAVLHRLGMSMHPDKTSIGPTRRGFTFLGVDFLPRLTTLCRETQTRIETTLGLLSAQAPGRAAAYRKGLSAWLVGLGRCGGLLIVTGLAGPGP
jgi:hypothetical protein